MSPAASPRSPSWLDDLCTVLVSLRLTVVLLGLAMILVFAATLDQVELGIWSVQEKYFRSFVVYAAVGPLTVPVFPGGYAIGGLLLANLVAAHFHRFVFTWRRAGIVATHLGLILLLVGELLSGLWQRDYHLRLDTGETRSYAESFQRHELVLIDVSRPEFDTVYAIPDTRLTRRDPLTHAGLPFGLTVKSYYPNSTLRVRAAAAEGAGEQLTAVPLPITHRPDERNVPSAIVEVAPVGEPVGTYLVSAHVTEPQIFSADGRDWQIALRAQRAYQPFSLTLLEFRHDRHEGTEIPRNFSSRLRLMTPDGREDREVAISMNEPLRYGGFTFYQAGFENNDRTTVLQVVRNPSWMIPYLACGLVTLGLALQFGLHLLDYTRQRGGRAAREKTARGVGQSANGPAGAGRLFPGAVLVLTLGAVALTLRPPSIPSEYNLTDFGRLPVLMNGRVKPLDTVARTALLTMQGRQTVTTADGHRLAPIAWLLDLLHQPERADEHAVFEITHPEVLGLLDLTASAGAGGKRFALRQFAGRLAELDRQARLADGTDAPARTAFQRAVIQLRNNVGLYQRLQGSLVAFGVDDFLEQLRSIESPTAVTPPAAREEMVRMFAAMDAFSGFRPIPPTGGAEVAGWRTIGSAWQENLAAGGRDPATLAYAAIGRAWRKQQPQEFNAAVHQLRQHFAGKFPEVQAKADAEVRSNFAQPFYTSIFLYVGAFLAAVISWLRWPQALRRVAFGLIAIAFTLTTLGIATRMWLEGRPPVTNLYSSALFVGWAAVALCLVLERLYRNAMGSAAAGLIGFGTLLIAHHLALGADTLEMMRAVLDSNFWLATHVVVIAMGYSATFLAGFLGAIYLLRAVLTRGFDEATATSLGRMIYGVVCFATLFSFVGTVLGGIWADQSWGRFWGWDPKENGALLIVIWNSILLHARWAGAVRSRGLAALAVFGNIVTAWSWFGVNMLGVGLHSYGFMDAAFWWLIAFVASQLALIVLATIPVSRWRSRGAN